MLSRYRSWSLYHCNQWRKPSVPDAPVPENMLLAVETTLNQHNQMSSPDDFEHQQYRYALCWRDDEPLALSFDNNRHYQNGGAIGNVMPPISSRAGENTRSLCANLWKITPFLCLANTLIGFSVIPIMRDKQKWAAGCSLDLVDMSRWVPAVLKVVIIGFQLIRGRTLKFRICRLIIIFIAGRSARFSHLPRA